MGVKRSLQKATNKLSERLRRTGPARSLSTPSSISSLRDRGIEWLYLLVFFLLAGGIINASQNVGIAGIGSSIIVPSPNAQSVIETFILLFVYVVGALGAYAMFLSGRQTIRARSAELFFVGGIILLSIALVFGYYVLSVK